MNAKQEILALLEITENDDWNDMRNFHDRIRAILAVHDLVPMRDGLAIPLEDALQEQLIENDRLCAELAALNEHVDELRAKLMRADAPPLTETDIMFEVRKAFPMGGVRSHTAITEFARGIIDRRIKEARG